MSDETDQSTHEIEIAVRGYHLDLYGHVNNARYLEFLEEARWAWFEERSDLATILGDGPSMVMVRLEIDYRYPAGIGDRLIVATQLTRVGARSAVIHQEILLASDGRPVVDADITVVLVDPVTGRALPIEGRFLEFFEALG